MNYPWMRESYPPENPEDRIPPDQDQYGRSHAANTEQQQPPIDPKDSESPFFQYEWMRSAYPKKEY